MINTIIHSVNNPARLRILLQSIQKNSGETFNLNILHQPHKDKNIEALYDRLKQEFRGINWLNYSDFKQNILLLLQNNSILSLFLRDDDIIYRKELGLKNIETTLVNHQDSICFSLRLGKNTKLSQQAGTTNTLYGEIELPYNMMKFDWQKHYLDYHDAFSTGNVFRTKDLLKFIKSTQFSNFDEMEYNMSEIFETFPKNMMLSFRESVLVKDISGPAQEQITQLWNSNKPIELEEMKFDNVDGAWCYISKPTREVIVETEPIKSDEDVR
jgi:hypothetical protein